MAKDAAGTLARLARREVDAERRALAALDGRRSALLERIAAAGRASPEETEAARHLPGGGMLLARWLAARREQARALAGELEGLDWQRAGQLERLAARRLEERRLERLGERRQAAAARAAARSEEKTLDDLIGARATCRVAR